MTTRGNILTVIATLFIILGILFGGLLAYANQAYFPNSEGVAVVTKVAGIEPMIKEIRDDIKILLRGTI